MSELVAEDRPWLKGFNAFYERELVPEFARFERLRMAARKTMITTAIVTAALAIPLVVYGLMEGNDWIAGGGILAGALGAVYAVAEATQYKRLFKRTFVHKICGFFDLRYDPRGGAVNVARYRSLRLIPAHDRMSREDQITGSYRSINFTLSELHLKQRRRTKNRTYYVTVFRGPVAQFDFPKKFTGRTIISSNLDRFGHWGSELEKVRLEDPVFERRFEVYGTDQVQSRYILTPGFMEKVMAADDRVRGKLKFAFDNQQCYLSANNNHDYFEASSALSYESIEQMIANLVREISLAYDLIDILDLELHVRNSEPSRV